MTSSINTDHPSDSVEHAFPTWCGVCDPEPEDAPTVAVDARRLVPSSGGRHRKEDLAVWQQSHPMGWREKLRLMAEGVFIGTAVMIVGVFAAVAVVGLVWGWS